MGDMFHQTNAQQSAVNQQVGLSTRDVGGNVLSIGGGTSGNIRIQNLDPAALAVANNAITAAGNAVAQSSIAQGNAFSQALQVAGETSQSALQVAASGAGSGANVQAGVAPTVLGGLNPSQIIWIALGVVAVVLLAGYVRRR